MSRVIKTWEQFTDKFGTRKAKEEKADKYKHLKSLTDVIYEENSLLAYMKEKKEKKEKE